MFRKTLIAASLAALAGGMAHAAVTADEAKQLGTTLTPIGAEKAGNKDGTIPEWTGGVTTPPAGFTKGAGLRPEPFPAEKPRLTITGKNADENKDKLTAATYALLKKFPSYRIDVYPTHRTATLPKRLLDSTAKNATAAKSTNNGLSIEGAYPGVPFPIPKSGSEVMWNHLTRYIGNFNQKFINYNVDSAGVATLATAGNSWQEYPIYAGKGDAPMKGSDTYYEIKVEYTDPARRAGEALIVKDSLDPLTNPRRAWQYLPGQRRVKAAPDIAYDTPNPATAGLATYDDTFVFNGALDRYDWKLVGKKEMFVPYNNYRFTYYQGDTAKVTTPNHLSADVERWELHRVWVVEATLKEGKRHIYAKRTFYVDEDSWVAVAADNYDARGQLFRGSLMFPSFSYDQLATTTSLTCFYDFVAGAYSLQGWSGPKGGLKYSDGWPESSWQPEALAGAGVR